MGEVLLTGDRRFGTFGSRSGLALALLLAAVALAALFFGRRPEGLSGDELRVIAAAQSLAHDLDLELDADDRQRLARLVPDLADRTTVEAILESPSAADRPWLYPLLIAPLVRWAPLRGPLLLNALLLLVVAWVVSRRLTDHLGGGATAVVAVGLFASVLYRNVYSIQPTVLLAALVAIAFSLVLGQEEPGTPSLREIYRAPDSTVGGGARGLLVGGLIGLVAVHHPVYLLLVLPAATLWPAARRRSGLAGIVCGLGAVLLAAGLPTGLWGGAPADWLDRATSVITDNSVGLAGWNLLYLLIGRNTGILPYFLPMLALIGLWQGGERRSVLVVTAIVGVLTATVLSPFDYFGGAAAIGNRWLIPWLVLLLYVPRRPLPRGWIAASVLLALPAMYPTWIAADSEPLSSAGVYRHASGRWHRWLPVETTQRALPPVDQAIGQRFWVRSLSLHATPSGGNRWRLAGDEWCELQLATPTSLESVYLQFGQQAGSELQVRGADLGDTVLLADGGVGFRLENLRRRALHPMWWSPERFHNYVLQLRMPMSDPEPQSLVLTAIAEGVTGGRQ